jgi:hypothetical protein
LDPGVEGNFSREVSSKEHFPERPYARVMPEVRRPSLSVPGFGHTFKNDTTYHTNVENVVQVSIFFFLASSPTFRANKLEY